MEIRRKDARCGKRRRRAWALILLGLAALCGMAAAQRSGSLEGKLTDLHARPEAGATVVVRNLRTGSEARAVTAANGGYSFDGLEPGEYALEATSAALGRGQVRGIVVSASHRARVMTAVALEGREKAPVAVVRVYWTPGSREARSAAAPVLAAIRPAPPTAAVPPARMAPVAERVAETPPVSASVAPAVPAVERASVGASVGSATPNAAKSTPANPRASIPAVQRTPAAEVAANATVKPLVVGAAVAMAAPPAAVVAARVTPGRTGAMLAAAGAAGAQLLLQMAAEAPRRSLAAANGPEPEQAAVTTTLSSEEMESLPLAGRNWVEFMPNQPPGTPAADADATTGARIPEPGLAVEGASMRLAFGGRGAGRASSSSMMGPGATEAAVRGIEMADSAAMGAGERLSVRTMSGENPRGGRLRGQVFLFDRQNVLGAQNPFTQWVKETSPAAAGGVPTFTPEAWTPGDRRLTLGAGVGGPLKGNRLFWFGALDTDLRNDPAVSTVKHPYLCANPPQCTETTGFFAQPSNDEMQVLSARLELPAANPVAEGLAAYSKMLETLDGLLGPAGRTSNQFTGFGRIDWKARERHRFTLEGTGARWDSPGGGLSRASETYGTHSFGVSQRSETWLLGRWEAFLTANLVAVTEASMGRAVVGLKPETPSAFEQTLNANLWNELPQMVIDSRYGFTIGNPARFDSGTYPNEHFFAMREDLGWARGPVQVRGGMELRHSGDATSMLRNHFGTYHYAHVENFISDALVFQKYGLSDALDPMNQHNCDERLKAWRDAAGQLHGLGYLPCYSYYTQELGPADWHLETNDWAGFASAQWQPAKRLAMTAGVRWEREDMPPPIGLVNNPELPLTTRLPSLGNEFAPRVSLAWGMRESRWPVVRLGYGMYYGRTSNALLETALTETGSLKGDVNLFMRPMDNLQGEAGGAPPFPYLLAGDPGTIVKPGAVEMAPGFRNAEVHQAVASMEEELPRRILVSASAVASLARRLPVTMDTNFDPAVNPGTITYSVVDASGIGPIKTPQITVPFFASWPSATGGNGRLNPDYQQISELFSRANLNYEAGVFRVSRTASRGFSFHFRYAYAHATDWNPDESDWVPRASVLDPTDFKLEYGASSLDIRNSASAWVIWDPPWKVGGEWRRVANGWRLSGMGQYHSGLPFTMRTSGSVSEKFTASGALIAGLGPGMNGYGGDDRVYGVGRNTYRYPATWKADMRLAKRFTLSRGRELELMAETFNLFNHQNVTELETVGYYVEPGSVNGTLPTLNFLTGLKAGQTEFGQPLNVNATDFYRERQFDFGIRIRFKRSIGEAPEP